MPVGDVADFERGGQGVSDLICCADRVPRRRSMERSNMAGRILAVVIVIGVVTIAATTGDSWAVRTTLVLVGADIVVRLWRWSTAR
jgi:protein-S-isoprenylcysteine O-methyltransferase Ste14